MLRQVHENGSVEASPSHRRFPYRYSLTGSIVRAWTILAVAVLDISLRYIRSVTAFEADR
jgi:hypothetical protein